MTDASEEFRQLEVDAEVLKKIAEMYAPTSPEFGAIRRAAMALTYVVMHDREKFAAFMEETDRDLSIEERDELRKRYDVDA